MVVKEKPHRKRTKKQKQQQQQNRMPHLYLIIRDIITLFELDKENYYEPVRIGNAFSSSYTEYESKRDRNKTLSIEEYLDKIRLYFSNMINILKTKDEWKILSTMAINLMSFKDTNGTRPTRAKSDDIKIIISNKTNEMVEGFFNSLLQKFQKGLEESIKVASLLLTMLIYCIINIMK